MHRVLRYKLIFIHSSPHYLPYPFTHSLAHSISNLAPALGVAVAPTRGQYANNQTCLRTSTCTTLTRLHLLVFQHYQCTLITIIVLIIISIFIGAISFRLQVSIQGLIFCLLAGSSHNISPSQNIYEAIYSLIHSSIQPSSFSSIYPLTTSSILRLE